MSVQRIFANTIKAAALVLAGSCALAAPALAQPLPSPGHAGCYAKIAYPVVYKTVVTRVPGAPIVTYRDTAPVVAHYARQVLVAPARVEHETLPPVYKTVWRWTEVAGPTRTVPSPPIYRTVTTRRLIAPAHLVWRPGGVPHGFAAGGGYGQDDGYTVRAHPTGEVLCRVLVPARYAWARSRVLVSPGRQMVVQGPRRRVRVQDRVLVQPARTTMHTVAAVYRTVDATRVVRPAGRQKIVTPGPVRLVSNRVIVSPAHFGWAPIVCLPKSGPIYRAPKPQPPTTTYGNQGYVPPSSASAQSYGDNGYGAAPPESSNHAYRPDEILAPTPHYQSASPPLVPAPYDVGHPARR